MEPTVPNPIVGSAEVPEFLEVGTLPAARRIACLRRAARDARKLQPGLVWLGGYASDMHGTKAGFLDLYAAAEGLAYLRFDYSGHGASSGRLQDGTIGLWLEESLAAIRALTRGPQVLVGSSMGAWLALLVARAFEASAEADRLEGLLLVAPAVDFTERLLWERMSSEARATLLKDGVWLRQSAYSPEPYPITKAFIDEGRNHLLLDGVIRTRCPVHVVQGLLDDDVPWQHAMALVEHLAADPVTVTLVKDGDHRLSREEDLATLRAAIDAMVDAPSSKGRSRTAVRSAR